MEEGRNACERPGPVGLEERSLNPSRGPQHFAGPPRNKTDITQIKKIRQCVISKFREKEFERPWKNTRRARKRSARSCLRTEKAVIDSPPITVPLF